MLPAMQNDSNLRTLIAICCLILTIQTQAKNLILDYEPSGQIIRFDFDSLTIYTDTTSVFSIVDNYDDPNYTLRTRTLIMNKIIESGSDTITFSGHFIPFNDSIDNKYQKDWYIDYVIIHLTDRSKLKIFDKAGRRVKAVKTKRIKTKGKGGFKSDYRIRIAYINRDTDEEMFSKFVKGRISQPAW